MRPALQWRDTAAAVLDCRLQIKLPGALRLFSLLCHPACGLSGAAVVGWSLYEPTMARMLKKTLDGRYIVRIKGQMSAQDLRRLEKLCGPALEQKTIPLTLLFERPSSIDESARAYLERLVERGAVLVLR